MKPPERLRACRFLALLCPGMTVAAANGGAETTCIAPVVPACLSERSLDAACNDEVQLYRRSADSYRHCLATEYGRLTAKPR